ncbi:Vesicle transport through interaction with t-SNAREs 1A [Liparis tanakae]|uniref:Vesicle transport through interaction with t-SNAREs 1A n=1 Tax=Liparis tanakae TaxID=230148 RepID=A0A4Z2IX96_9TELE|nr:Vesicle transport through interaction with t-SNAREs 1A [Liparis tanakae]
MFFSEQVGQEILSNLNSDREKIQRARERLRETDANLGKSSRILTGMLRSTPLKSGFMRVFQSGGPAASLFHRRPAFRLAGAAQPELVSVATVELSCFLSREWQIAPGGSPPLSDLLSMLLPRPPMAVAEAQIPY